jgi:hypothetical protein
LRITHIGCFLERISRVCFLHHIHKWHLKKITSLTR